MAIIRKITEKDGETLEREFGVYITDHVMCRECGWTGPVTRADMMLTDNEKHVMGVVCPVCAGEITIVVDQKKTEDKKRFVEVDGHVYGMSACRDCTFNQYIEIDDGLNCCYRCCHPAGHFDMETEEFFDENGDDIPNYFPERCPARKMTVEKEGE